MIILNTSSSHFDLLRFCCQIYYRKDGNTTLKVRYNFDNKDKEFLLLDGYYLYSILEKGDYNKAINIETGKEIYFADLIKPDSSNPIPPFVEDNKKSFWNKFMDWINEIF